MHVRPLAAAAALVLAAASLAACGGSTSSSTTSPAAGSATSAASATAEGPLSVVDPWVKATDTEMTGAFAVLRNPGSADVTVVSAASPLAGMTELHETVMKDGQMVMQPKEGGFVVPAGGDLALEPGGNHIMLMKLTAEVKPGEEVPVTLTLSSGETVDVTAVAKEFTGAQESYAPSGAVSPSMSPSMSSSMP